MARFCAAMLLTAVKEPPITTPVGVTARALTTPSVLGAQALTVPSAAMWARVGRPRVSTLRKSPPRYQPPWPSGAAARTMPSISGLGPMAPLVVLTLTPYPVVRPT